MTRVCGECGHEVPDDMDFCPYCGSRATMSVSNEGIPEMICPSCGTPFHPGDMFCGKCGTSLPSVSPQMMMPRMRKNGSLAVMVSLIAGFLNVFGLGHLILKQYVRGVMFLIISAIIWYLNDFNLFSQSFAVMLLTIAVYFYQVMDVARIVFSPEGRR